MAKRSVFAYVKTKQSTKVMQKFSEKKRGKRDCVIYNTKTKKAIKCQFNPSDLPRTRSANYASVTAPGMAYPVIQFVNGETEDIDIELFFYKPEKTEEIRTFDKFIDGLLPPKHNKKGFKSPPTFKFYYGTYKDTFVLVKKSISEEVRNSNGNVISAKYTLTARRV